MSQENEFDSICPYNDEEAVKALNKVANHPAVLIISEYLFPDEKPTYLRNALKQVRSIDDFQEAVMNKAVQWCIDNTIRNFSYDGISYIKGLKGKFLAELNSLYLSGGLTFPDPCKKWAGLYEWKAFRDHLYKKDWCPFIKKTFNGFGNAIEYLGRYTHKIAISNSRLLSVTESHVSFSARARRPGDARRVIVLTHEEFIRRFLMHVLPSGFQKIRYYGFLNNRMKSKNLKLIFRIQGYQKFRHRYFGMNMAELLKACWKTDIRICPVCGCHHMQPVGRIRAVSG